MEKATVRNVPIWKLVYTFQSMIDEGYTRVDITIEDDLTISLRGLKETDEDLPDINQLIV